MDTKKEEILIALEDKNGIVTDACASIGMARSTFYSWLSTDAAFKLQVEAIQEVALDYVEGKLFERIRGVTVAGKEDKRGAAQVYDLPPDVTAIIFYLKTKGKKRGYVERTELTGKDGEALFDPSALTTDELIILRNLEAKARNGKKTAV